MLPGCGTVADLVLRNQFFIPTSHILAKLGPLFPFSRSYQSAGQMSLSNPVFSMVPEQNKVRLGLTAAMTAGSQIGQLSGISVLGNLAGLTTGGTCQLACGLRYDPTTRGVFLKEPVVEELDIHNFSSALSEPFRQVVNLFGPQILDKHPIHTLEPSLASRFLGGMEVQPTGIALKFG